MSPIIEGVLFGLLLASMVGPVFFLLLHAAIEKGARYGVAIGFGATASDMVIMALSFVGMLQISEKSALGKSIGLFGSIMLLLMGIYMIRKPIRAKNGVKKNGISLSVLAHFIKGFLLNTLNPFVFIFWFGVVGFVSNKYQYDEESIKLFSFGLFIALIVTDLLKAYFAKKLRPLIKSSTMNYLSMGMGGVFILYSIHLLYRILAV